MEQQTASNDAPTATEFIPADENGYRTDTPAGARRIQATGDGGAEEVAILPCDGDVKNRVFICDECGQSETLDTDMAFHLNTEH